MRNHGVVYRTELATRAPQLLPTTSAKVNQVSKQCQAWGQWGQLRSRTWGARSTCAMQIVFPGLLNVSPIFGHRIGLHPVAMRVDQSWWYLNLAPSFKSWFLDFNPGLLTRWAQSTLVLFFKHLLAQLPIIHLCKGYRNGTPPFVSFLEAKSRKPPCAALRHICGRTHAKLRSATFLGRSAAGLPKCFSLWQWLTFQGKNPGLKSEQPCWRSLGQPL